MTKNNDAWMKIFEQYRVLAHIEKYGDYTIKSEIINTFRQTRLMVKFDTKADIPEVFSSNNLSILPISRNEYVIGKFLTHHYLDVKKFTSESDTFSAPPHETINPDNINSESRALNLAVVSGVIKKLIQDDNIEQTLSGRMSTQSFDFFIQDIIDLSKKHHIKVNNSQCEIDAGFESDKYLYLIEAKSRNKINDFLVRQLYYPFRSWSTQTTKIVVPVLMTYSKESFDFYIFKFEDDKFYNSLTEIKHLHFLLEPEPISFSEINDIHQNITLREITHKMSFPQADSVKKSIDLLQLLHEHNRLTQQEIMKAFKMVKRQAQYYANFLIYFNFVQRHKDKTVFYSLTKKGQNLFKENSRKRYLKIVEAILQDPIFNDVFELSKICADIPSKTEIKNILRTNYPNLKEKTIDRRSTTIINWIRWIIELAN